jgi:hypothetical protein
MVDWNVVAVICVAFITSAIVQFLALQYLISNRRLGLGLSIQDIRIGPRPEEERLSNDQIIEKYGADLVGAQLREQILQELVEARKLSIAVNRKSKKESAADDAWIAAYVKRYGTDEG